MYPQRLASTGIGRDDRPPVARREVEDTVHHERRVFILDFQPAAEIVALPRPCKLEVLDVVRVDLVQRRVPRVSAVATDPPPLAIYRRAFLRGDTHSDRKDQDREDQHPRLPNPLSYHVVSPCKSGSTILRVSAEVKIRKPQRHGDT